MKFYWFSLLGLSALICGCGGGSGGGASTGGTGGSASQSLGPFTTTYDNVAAPKPFSAVGGSVLVYGLAGTTFSNVTYSPPKLLSNTRIAFTYANQLYTMAPDGSDLTQVTADMGRGFVVLPSWSPTVAGLVFLGNQGSGYRDFRINADGSSEIALATHSNLLDVAPQWSPDGTKILLNYLESSSGHTQIFTEPAAGGSDTRISNGTADDTSPAWSPNGAIIAFVRGSDIWTMSATGASLKQVTHVGAFGSVAWAPDGQRLIGEYYDGSKHQLAISDLNGTVDIMTGPYGYNFYSPSFSPDGKQIVCHYYDGSSNLHMGIMNSGGAGLTNVMNEAFAPAWSTYFPRKVLVGSGSSFSSTASGFLFSQVKDTVNSVVIFGSSTPSGVSITNVGSSSNNLGFQISGTLNSLKYTNNPISTPTTVVPYGSTATVNGAFISMNTSDGHVSLVAPYAQAAKVSSSATSVKFQGKFLAVYNESGKNIAPNGASVLEVETKTGKALAVRP